MAQVNKQDLGPATPSKAYEVMAPRWKMISSLLGGTEAMREAGKTFMPQHERESDNSYKERLNTTTLFNGTELTLDGLVGKPFADPITIGEDVPPELKTYLEDIDLQGHNIDVFAKMWFREALAKGFSHVLVDFPRPTVDPANPNKPRTLEDDRKEGRRPYWVHICPENVVFMRATISNGQMILEEVRILETELVQDGWEEVLIERVRVLTPGQVTMYRKNQAGKYEVEETYTTGLGIIPFVTFYTADGSLMEVKPPLLDLAFLNVTHWQSSSDQRVIITVARFPMLAVSGVNSDDTANLAVGPKQVLSTSDPQGKWYYVESSGASIAAGDNDLKRLEEQMGSYGATFLKVKPGNPTATARALDTAETLSPLQTMAVMFDDALATALFFSALWLNKPDGGSLQVNKEFSLTANDAADIDALNKARDRRDISRKAYIAELLRRNILGEEYDIDEDETALEEEVLTGASATDLDPAAPKVTDPSKPTQPAPDQTQTPQA